MSCKQIVALSCNWLHFISLVIYKELFAVKSHSTHYRLLAILMAGTLTALSSYAEAPMVTDDAGTLDKNGKKFEGGFAKTGSERSYILGAGFSPVDTLELGASFQHARDKTIPATANGTGLVAKWIPYKNGIFSAGLKLDWLRVKVKGGGAGRETTLTALASARFESGYVVHANAGRTSISGGGHANNWAMGLEVPVAEKVQITGDLYGTTGSDTGKQIGVRWELQKGLKLSAAVGRADALNTVFTGFSWEF
jgi:hypothetical protein